MRPSAPCPPNSEDNSEEPWAISDCWPACPIGRTVSPAPPRLPSWLRAEDRRSAPPGRDTTPTSPARIAGTAAPTAFCVESRSTPAAAESWSVAPEPRPCMICATRSWAILELLLLAPAHRDSDADATEVRLPAPPPGSSRLEGLGRLAEPYRIGPSPSPVGSDFPQHLQVALAAKVPLDRREQPAPIRRGALVQHALDHRAGRPGRRRMAAWRHNDTHSAWRCRTRAVGPRHTADNQPGQTTRVRPNAESGKSCNLGP
jgi:hypothetical protein